MNTKDQDSNLMQTLLSNSESAENIGLFRVKLFYNLDAEMKVTSVNGRSTDLKSTKVLVDDIGPSGLKFISNLVLPVNPTIVFNFKTVILDETINVSGHIVWKEESLQGLYSYGLKFIQTNNEKEHLIEVFNSLQECIRKSPLVNGCSFYTGDSVEFFIEKHNKPNETFDLEEKRNYILRREDEILDNYKELLEIYRNYNDNEEIKSLIFNFIKRVKQVVDKFDV